MSAIRDVQWVSWSTTSDSYTYGYPYFPIRFGANYFNYLGISHLGSVELGQLNNYGSNGTPHSLDYYLYSPIVYTLWAQVDESAEIKYGNAMVDETRAFVVNWTNVSFEGGSSSITNDFQFVLFEAPGGISFEMNYGHMQWDASPQSGGNMSGLFDKRQEIIPGEMAPALVGYRLNNKLKWEAPGSMKPGGLLDSNLQTGLIHGSRNSDVPGRYAFSSGGAIEDPNSTGSRTSSDESDEVGNRRWFARQGT